MRTVAVIFGAVGGLVVILFGLAFTVINAFDASGSLRSAGVIIVLSGLTIIALVSFLAIT